MRCFNRKNNRKAEPRFKKKTAFTLLELITAMAIFSILMVVMMRFFNEAQQAWTMSSNRADIYDNARIAMNLISRDIQSSVYQKDQTPFWHCDLATPETDTHTKEMLAFVSATSIRPNTYSSPICEIKYKLYYTTDSADKLAGWLMRSTTGDVNDDKSTNVYNNPANLTGKWIFQGIFNVGKTGAANAFTRDDASGGDETTTYDSADYVKIIPYVTNLRFDCFDKKNQYKAPLADSTDFVLNSATHDSPFPSMIKVTLKLLDKNSWNKWLAMGAKPNEALDDSDGTASGLSSTAKDNLLQFRKSQERAFTKIIFMKNKTD